MNEKLQYASMLEIPVSTCNITYKPIKKKKTKRKKLQVEDVKNQVINLANSYVEGQESLPQISPDEIEAQVTELELQPIQNEQVKIKKKRKFNIVTAQFLLIGALIVTIIATSVMNTNSGLNTFFKSVFGTANSIEQVDERLFNEFAPVINMENLSSEYADGVMSFTGSDSAYACLDGTVKSLVKGEDGKYTMEISHSQNFSSVLSGLKYAYASEGDSVYKNVPVGYFEDELSMCFNGSDGDVICDFEVIDGSVVWAV